jgi:hypothetical protein
MGQGDAAALLADRVSQKLAVVSPEGWASHERIACAFTGTLILDETNEATKRQAAQMRLKNVFKEVLASQAASFDVAIFAMAMVDGMGPAMSLEV